MTLLALWLNTASAGDYTKDAEELMDLSFDIDAVQGMLRDQKRAAPRAAMPSPAAPYDSYNQPAYQPAPMLPLEPNSKVDTVVVYRDRALVSRYRELTVPVGTSSITFEGLPLGLASDSLHAQAREGNFRVVGVELLSGQGKVEETTRITEIRSDAEKYTDELGGVRDRVESLLAQRAYLRGALNGGGDKVSPTVDQMRSTMAYVGDSERDIASKLRVEQEKAKDIDEKLSPMLVKLANPLATGMTVRVDIEATKAGSVELGLRYQVFGAAWWPSYNARLDEATSRVELEYYGMVSQSTGDVWTDATLLLSTADPSISGSVPSLQAWHLGGAGYDANVAGNLQAGRGYYEEYDNDGTYAAATTSSVVSSNMSAKVQGSGAVVFAIPGKRTIKGDGSEQRLPIGTQTFESTIELATVPKVVPEVYRSARFKYEGTAPILPGQVAAFVGADYVGSAAFDTTIPGEDLLVGFGSDPSLKVTRTLVSRNTETLGAGKKTMRYTFEFKIDVQNFGKTERTVTVTDQVPVPDIEKVVVEKLEGTTPSLEPAADDPAGVTKWKVTVAPGKSQAITLKFSVTAPRDPATYPQLEYQLEQML